MIECLKNIRLRWWKVDYWRVYEPAEDDPMVSLIWKGWNVYGRAWRWEVRSFKNFIGQRINTLLADDIFPRTSKPPPMRLKYYPGAK